MPEIAKNVYEHENTRSKSPGGRVSFVEIVRATGCVLEHYTDPVPSGTGPYRYCRTKPRLDNVKPCLASPTIVSLAEDSISSR